MKLTGRLKEWDHARAWGFIEGPERDEFVHISAFREAGIQPRLEMILEYEVQRSAYNNRFCAQNLKVVGEPEAVEKELAWLEHQQQQAE